MVRKHTDTVLQSSMTLMRQDLDLTITGCKSRQSIGLTPDLSRYTPSESKTIMERLDVQGLVFKYRQTDPTTQNLIENFMLFYAIADKKPDGSLKTVTTNIPIDKEAFEWLKDAFRYFDVKMPEFHAQFIKTPKIRTTGTDTISCFSTGKDSTYMTLATDSIPVHVTRINRSTSTREIRAVEQFLPFLPRTPVIIPAYSSLKLGPGYQAYHLRDALMYMLMVPVAQDRKANKIYSGAYSQSTKYSTTAEGVMRLNELLEKKGIRITVEHITRLSEEEVIRRMIVQYPKAFAMTHPCVLDDMMFSIRRKWFTKKFPEYPLMPGSCGMCGKDIELNMARLMHDPQVARISQDAQKQLATYYVQRSQDKSIADFIEQELVEKVRQKYHLDR